MLNNSGSAGAGAGAQVGLRIRVEFLLTRCRCTCKYLGIHGLKTEEDPERQLAARRVRGRARKVATASVNNCTGYDRIREIGGITS
jgi:hypothetical protein